MTNTWGGRQGHLLLHPLALYPPLDDCSLRGCIDFAEITSQFPSLPLNRRRRLYIHVIHNALEDTHFGDDSIRNLALYGR
jgi:hypothetical protein